MSKDQLIAHYQYFQSIKSVLMQYEDMGFDQFSGNRDTIMCLVSTRVLMYKLLLYIVSVMNRESQLFLYKVNDNLIDFMDFVIQGDKELYVMYTYANDSVIRTCKFKELEIMQ